MSLLLIIIVVGAVVFVGGGALVFVILKASSNPALGVDRSKALADGRTDDGGVDVLSASITDVRAGGMVKAAGFGDDFEDIHLEIDAYNRLSFNKENWHELVSQYKGRAVAVEWQERSGGRKVYGVRFHRGKELLDIGLQDADLDSLEDGRAVALDGIEYKLARSGEALFHKGGDGFGKKMNFWEFQAEEGGLLRVERASDGTTTVSVAKPLNEAEFEVLRVRS